MATTPQSITIDNQEIRLILHKHARAKQIALRILESECAIKLTIPKYCSIKAAMTFLEERKAWISNHLHLLRPKTSIVSGLEISILGKPHTIHHITDEKFGIKTEDNQLLVSGLEENLSRRVARHLKNQMKEYSIQQAQHYAETLSISHKLGRITIRETTSRWGSCSHTGTISLCWRLILAPKAVLNYVILHEICHLKEMNHSPNFWQLVASQMPDYHHHKNWLKRHGNTLWRYSF